MMEVDEFYIGTVQSGQLGVDENTLTLHRKKITIPLTKKEKQLVICMMEHLPDRPNQVQLLESIGWDGRAAATTHTIATHISSIRKKLTEKGENDLIRLEKGEYYIHWP